MVSEDGSKTRQTHRHDEGTGNNKATLERMTEECRRRRLNTKRFIRNDKSTGEKEKQAKRNLCHNA